MPILRQKGIPTRDVAPYPQDKIQSDKVDAKLAEWDSIRNSPGGWWKGKSIPTTKDPQLRRQLASNQVEYDEKPTSDKAKDFAINAGLSLLPEIAMGVKSLPALKNVTRGLIKSAKNIPGITADAPELGFHALNKNHWALHPSQLEASTKEKMVLYIQAIGNRTLPIIKKTPLATPIKRQAEKIMGAAPWPIRSADELLGADVGYKGTFTGSRLPGNSNNRDLIKLYLYGDERGFVETGKNTSMIDFGDRYKSLYPKAKSYEMSAISRKEDPVYLDADFYDDLLSGKPQSLPAESANPITPLDNIAGHQVSMVGPKDNKVFVTQDLWKFNPKDYSSKWGGKPGVVGNKYKTLLAEKQAGMVDKVGRPFYLVQNNKALRQAPSWYNKEMKASAQLGKLPDEIFIK
jgi:hypothetical protein